MNIANIVKIAKREALRSNDRHKIGAVIFGKKVIISKGHNCKQRGAKSLLPIFQKRPKSIHAEVAAILRAKQPLYRFNLLVVRVNRFGELRLAKPCDYCMAYLNYVGIKTIIYSTNTGKLERIKL